MIPEQPIFNTWTGDGTTTVFNHVGRIYLAADLWVYTYNPATDTLPVKLTSGYTVAIANDFSGATVTITPAPAAGVKVGTIRRMDLTQDVNISNTDYVPPSVVEQQIDRQVMMNQEAVRFATVGLTADPFEWTTAARAGKAPVFDNAGSITYTDGTWPLQGAWSAATTYAMRDVVTRDGAAYISRIANNLNIDPALDSGTNWMQLTDNGSIILNGSGAPSAGIGTDGDYYIDNSVHQMYGPKASGVWPAPVNLIGPAIGGLLTTRGDLAVQGAVNAQRLGLGPQFSFLGSNGTDPLWRAANDARADLDAPVYVANRAALQALNTSKDLVASIYAEGLRNGRLVFNSANLSASVTADPNQYTYVPPSSDLTGASGAWVYDSGLFVGAFPTPALRSERSKMQDAADLRDWNGLDLTGVSDMATLVQAAINATAAAGVKLAVPGGKILLGSTITIPQFANMEGVGNPATGFSGLPSASPLTFFHLAHLGVGFNLLGTNDGPRRVAGFGTYRDQTAPGVGWAPIAAAADVQLKGVYDTCVEDIFFYNPTVAVGVTGNTAGAGSGNGRFTLRRLRGQALTFGLSITHTYDYCNIDDIEWWPWWSRDTNVLAYTRSTAKSLIFARCDWPRIGSVSSWGMSDGLYVNNQASVGLDGGLPAGTTTHMHIDTLNVDACNRGLVTDASANGASISIDRLTCTDDVFQAPAMITLAGSNGMITIKDLYAANTNTNAINIAGSGNNVRLGMHRSSGIDHDASGDPEFSVATGNTLTIASKPITSAGTVYSFAGTGRISSPDWINFTPTVTAATGTITTVATIAAGDCKYKLEGTTCIFDFTVTITTNGTGATALQVTLPFAAKKIGVAGGKSGAGPALSGTIQSAVARADFTKYDNTYPGADATTLRMTGEFEIA